MYYESFTPREIEIINLLVNGITPKEIGVKLLIAPSSVNTHIRNMKDKIGVRSITELILHTIQNKTVPDSVFVSNNEVECYLTHRENEVLKFLMEGKTSKEISRILDVNTGTIESHRKNILRKVRVQSTNNVIILHSRNLLKITLPNDDEFEDGLERPYNLTKRQFQVLGRLVSGLTSIQIAEALHLSLIHI